MKRLGVFGAGGMGREIAQLAAELEQWSEVFFVIDPEYIPEDRHIDGRRTFSLDEVCAKFPRDEVEMLVAVGETRERKNLFERIKQENLSFGRLIDPSVVVHEDTVLGEGVIILRGCILSTRAVLGDNAALSFGVILGHDNQVGEHAYLAPGVTTGGFVQWDSCSFGGLRACVREHVHIGRHAIVGQGAVVLKDVEDGQAVVGNPAKPLQRTKTNIF